jgi:CheY-like chemotaxis protein
VPNRILVVDDDLDDQLLISDAFTHSGQPCELAFADNGKCALDLMKNSEYKPELIILDLNMPVMNGFDVLKYLRTNGQLARIPVVVFTTSSETASVEKSYDLGANSYVVKPKTFPQLETLVADLFKYWFKTVRLSPPATSF